MQDLDALSALCKDSLKQAIKPQELAIFGRNWGEVELNASSLVYSVDSKVMFELPLPEVSQAQQTKVGARRGGCWCGELLLLERGGAC